jgi:chloramphenicol 3-O-phosphotransferase
MMDNTLRADIIILNGASSSGKSSIAKALQAIIEKPCIHWCIDYYLCAYQKGLWE